MQKRDPRPGVTLRLVTAALDVSQDVVVVGHVLTEVLLDRGEFRGEQAVAGQHERLDDPGDAAVAVAEGMNGDDVQVGHRASDHDVRVEVAVFEPVDDLRHQ